MRLWTLRLAFGRWACSHERARGGMCLLILYRIGASQSISWEGPSIERYRFHSCDFKELVSATGSGNKYGVIYHPRNGWGRPRAMLKRTGHKAGRIGSVVPT